MVDRVPHRLENEVLADRYEIQQQLGKKAGRQTLLARDRETQSRVVIKLLTFSRDFNWDDLKLFEREIETLRILSHPAIPCYLDSFQLDTSTYRGFALVQSYLPGVSLETWMQQGRKLSEAELQRIAKEILQILQYLHQRQPPVIHRDIKPSNILVTETAKHRIDRVYLVDFGSVQTLATREGRTVTVVGTYGYMPPEQFGDRSVPASDLYSLGVTLVALATGRQPTELPQRHLRLEFEAYARLSPRLTRWLQWLTAPDLAQRPSTAQLALDVLENHRSADWDALIGIERPLTTLELLWSGVWRGSTLGCLMGCAYGGVYGTLVFPFWGTLFGAMLGGGLGLSLGLVNGLSWVLWTRLCFWPLRDPKPYRVLLMLSSTFFSTLMGLLGMVMALQHLSGGMLSYFLLSPLTISAAAIAGLTMGAISRHFTRWYEQRGRRDRAPYKAIGKGQ